MDDQAGVAEVPRRRSRAEAEQLLAEYESSGLSAAEFCRKQGLSLATLARYRKRRAQGNAAPSGWLAVEVSNGGPAPESEAGSGLAVVLLGGRRIEIGRGFDARTLAQLLDALEQV